MSRKAPGALSKLFRSAFREHPMAWGVAVVGAGAWFYYDARRTAAAVPMDASEQRRWNEKVLARQRAKKADEAAGIGGGGKVKVNRARERGRELARRGDEAAGIGRASSPVVDERASK